MFCSVQGEGLYVGERQVFLRVAGCSLTCSWCDTLYGKVQSPRFVIHEAGEKRVVSNPVSLETVVSEVVQFAERNRPVGVVSITGGEPLEQPEYVANISARLRAAGYKVYLETAGLNVEGLEDILASVDVVAMDIKVPSSFGSDTWEAHAAFLSKSRDAFVAEGREVHKIVFTKLVVDTDTTENEIQRAAQLVAAVDRRIPVVLQPESDTLMSTRTPRETSQEVINLLPRLQRIALGHLDDVRIIPQCHKILKVR